MSPPRLVPPAERCCGRRPLLQGVQIIASYTVVVGMLGVLAFLTRTSGDKEERTASQALILVELLQGVMNAFALYAGLKGLIGVLLRDAQRLRVLFIYHIGQLLNVCVTSGYELVEACQTLERLQREHKAIAVTCQEHRTVLLVDFSIHLMLCTYFTYIVWSLVVRLEDGELGLPSTFGDHELAYRGLGDPWLFVGPPAGLSDANSLLAQQGPRGRQAAPEPYSGASQTLAAAGPHHVHEPFTGTPFRLE